MPQPQCQFSEFFHCGVTKLPSGFSIPQAATHRVGVNIEPVAYVIKCRLLVFTIFWLTKYLEGPDFTRFWLHILQTTEVIAVIVAKESAATIAAPFNVEPVKSCYGSLGTEGFSEV